MKRIFILGVLLAVYSSLTACGQSRDSEVVRSQKSFSQERSFAKSFDLSTDLQVQSIEDGAKLIIPAGTGVSILENTTVDGISIVRLGLEYQEESPLPQDVWVRADDFALAKLNSMIESDPYDEDGNELSLSEFSRKKMTYCYRYVKQYLLSHGMVNIYLPGASAWMAATELPKHGFKKSSRRADTAIVNDVCVYKGGPAGHGHIEVLSPKGWYYGYGYKSHSIQGRIFVGCYYK